MGDDTVALSDGIVLMAPGAAYVADEHTLVVADLHVGYAATLRARGYPVPEGDDSALQLRVGELLQRTQARRLVVAGDLVHGGGASRVSVVHARSALDAFVSFVREAGCAVKAVLGNHDRRSAKALEQAGVEPCMTARVGPHCVHHGDVPNEVARLRDEAIARAGRVIVGHVHPALVLDAGVAARAKRPAFVSARGVLMLPAFSPFARGGDVRSPTVHAQVMELVGQDDVLGVAVCVGGQVVPVGNVLKPIRLRRERRGPR